MKHHVKGGKVMIKRLKTERLILILIIIISLFGHLVYGIEGAKQSTS